MYLYGKNVYLEIFYIIGKAKGPASLPSGGSRNWEGGGGTGEGVAMGGAK